MLIQCPQCAAELHSGSVECFACGCILAEFVSEPKISEDKQVSRLIEKKALDVHPQDLPLGLTLLDRYTIRQSQEVHGLWSLYSVVDQHDGTERTLQMGSKSHELVGVTVQAIRSLERTAHVPRIIDEGVEPVPFFVYDLPEGEPMDIWKRSSPSMSIRLLLCEQLLNAISEWSKKGLTLHRFDVSKIFVHAHGFLWVHPFLFSVQKKGTETVQQALEWVYWMLSDHAQIFGDDHFTLKGLSIRHAMWIRSMVRRQPGIAAISSFWSAHIEDRKGHISMLRARQVYKNLFSEHVYSDGGDLLFFDLSNAVEQNLVWGTERCRSGEIVGYVDRVLLAFEGVYFAEELPEVIPLYQRLVLDQNVPLIEPVRDNFASLLIHLKIFHLLRMDWERILVQVIEKADSFHEWMEINRFRILFDVEPTKIMVPRPTIVGEHLALASFFLWFCDDEEEARMWFSEAQKIVGTDAFAYFQIVEAHHALFGKAPESMLEKLRIYGLELPLEQQIVLLEDLYDRLDIRDEQWIAQCRPQTTKDLILWCRGLFSTEEFVLELDEYCRSIHVQLRGFSISVSVSWDNVEEQEVILREQIERLAHLNQQNQIYQDKGFALPPLVPPFSDADIAKRADELLELERERKRAEEAQRNKEAQRDGFWILVLIFVALGVYIGIRWLA